MDLTNDRPGLCIAGAAQLCEADDLLMFAPVLADEAALVIRRRQLCPLASCTTVPGGADLADLAMGRGADLVEKLHRRKILQGHAAGMAPEPRWPSKCRKLGGSVKRQPAEIVR